MESNDRRKTTSLEESPERLQKLLPFILEEEETEDIDEEEEEVKQ
jgi:hypothetical protein